MKDAAPRIFRSLERQPGRQEFDIVVAAAVSAYGSLRNPSQGQAEDLSRLVLPLWSHVTSDTRRNLAATLSHTRRVPRPLVELLLASPIEVSAPFLVSSPVLTPDDLGRLSASSDERIVRLVENRLARPDAPVVNSPSVDLAAKRELTLEPLPTLNASDAAIPLSGLPEIASPALSADFLSVTPMMPASRSKDLALRSSAGVRETLRRMALTGRSADMPRSEPPSFAALLAAAMNRDDARFYSLLAEIFGLSDEMLAAVVGDAGGERLAVALKALKATAADAMSVLMLMKPAIGLDVAAFDAMTRFYASLKPEDCRSMISASRLRPASIHRPLTADEMPRAAEPRREFGRRKQRPEDRSANG